MKDCKDYYDKTSDPSNDLGKLINLLNTKHIHRIINLNDFSFFTTDKQIIDMLSTFNNTFTGWLNSLRLEKENNHISILRIINTYFLFYLSRFYKHHYNSLDSFPTNFNEFDITYYVSRESFLTSQLEKNKKHPITLIEYINKFSKTYDWSNDTLYPRILIIDKFFNWIYINRNIINNCSNFINTITSSNYPRISRKSHSTKIPIPHKYYKTLISLTYTHEYMVTHINDMAIGLNAGILNKKLYFPSIKELEENDCWKKIWGKRGTVINGEINLGCLNFTPIFFHEGTAYPITKCYRFYSIVDYTYKGNIVTRITPHYIRIIAIMEETGIRQHHIKWLDLCTFDSLIDYSRRSEYEPLIVNTDKSHGAWIATIRHEIINICNRQKEFNMTCENLGFHDDLWYGNNERSKFGKFKPLFRLNSKNVCDDINAIWSNLLLTLQCFIKDSLGDTALPDLVRMVEVNKTKTTGLNFDLYSISVDEYNIESFHLIERKLKARHLPHGLRVSFVNDKIHYLPASLIGTHLTGQTDRSVYYYNVFDPTNIQSHSKLLATILADNISDSENNITPEIAAKAYEINSAILKSIEDNPSTAISTYGLTSLFKSDDEPTGVDILLAKKGSQLAFNDTHICPFYNICPSHIINDYGRQSPCSQCPYAIRCVMHLPAISAAKDQAYEYMVEILKKITTYTPRGQVFGY